MHQNKYQHPHKAWDTQSKPTQHRPNTLSSSAPFMSVTKQPGEQRLQHAWVSRVTFQWTALCPVYNPEYTPRYYCLHTNVIMCNFFNMGNNLTYFILFLFECFLSVLFCRIVSHIEAVCISFLSPLALHFLSHLCVYQVIKASICLLTGL